MQPRNIENTQVANSAQPTLVSDVSFGSEVRILATTLPQFPSAKLFQLRVFRLRSNDDKLGAGRGTKHVHKRKWPPQKKAAIPIQGCAVP